MEILNVAGLNFSYPNAKDFVLKNINFTVNSGEFIVFCGQSACGKTTLLKMIKSELAPHGTVEGSVICDCAIGYVGQNPAQQIVTETVVAELAFGLENMGLDAGVIKRRIAEMASYFGLDGIFERKTDELSGGEQQLVNLASVMVTRPQLLLLDEPTAQLDPIAATSFINTLHRLNMETGLTIILVEHRLEEVFPIADKVMVMHEGELLLYDTPRNICCDLKNTRAYKSLKSGLPAAVRLYNGDDSDCPLTIRDAREYLMKVALLGGRAVATAIEESPGSEVMMEVRNVCFRYKKELPDILCSTNLKVHKGEIFCILGGNGAGKTTLVNVMTGISKPYRGKVTVNGKAAMLPQEPEKLFLEDRISENVKVHPYDVSGGELQKYALEKLLALSPDILILDEPTKGLDAGSKDELGIRLRELCKTGMTIIIVTHDIEFAAVNADRCALFFNGEIVSCDMPQRFFSENSFYTTAANRIARGVLDGVVTVDDILKGLGK